jgi:hypothetical protein
VSADTTVSVPTPMLDRADWRLTTQGFVRGGCRIYQESIGGWWLAYRYADDVERIIMDSRHDTPEETAAFADAFVTSPRVLLRYVQQ